MSRLYLLRRTDKFGWDEYEGFVISAADETRAREIAANLSSTEGPNIWRDARTTCTEIARRTRLAAGVVLGSFNAG